MLTLYSYPELFGVPDNNPFGLKVDTVLRLSHIDYQHKHIIDTINAPRGQLPYLTDNDELVTESNAIIEYLATYYNDLDFNLTAEQKNSHFLINRMLDNHLYWVMSYSRWQDEAYWPLFKAEFLHQLPELTPRIDDIRHYNIEKYYYQGIGRYSAAEIYNAGIADLELIATLLGDKPFLFGETVHAIDACCYGFLANILFFEINTPLRDFIRQNRLESYTKRIRVLLAY